MRGALDRRCKMIKANNICKSFRKDSNVLSNISLEIDDDKIVGIIGENGAGKTTLVKIITGLVIPSSGEIYYDDLRLTSKSVKKINLETAVVLDGGRSLQWRLTVEDNFKYFATLKDISKKVIRENIEKYAAYFEIENLLSQMVNNLSLGQKQIIAIVCSLICGAKYLFLDEPTNGLDLETKCRLIEVLRKVHKEEKYSVVITSHDLEFLLNVSDLCIVLDNGKILKKVDLLSEHFESSYAYYKKSFFTLGGGNTL